MFVVWGFGVGCLVFGVCSWVFGVWGLGGLRSGGLGCGVRCLVFGVWTLDFGVWGLGFVVRTLLLGVCGLGFRIQGSGLRI